LECVFIALRSTETTQFLDVAEVISLRSPCRVHWTSLGIQGEFKSVSNCEEDAQLLPFFFWGGCSKFVEEFGTCQAIVGREKIDFGSNNCKCETLHKHGQRTANYITLKIWYIYWLQMGCHPVAVVQYTFTHKQYTERHKTNNT